jgi:GNAT superfamily N-acetyltransferase
MPRLWRAFSANSAIGSPLGWFKEGWQRSPVMATQLWVAELALGVVGVTAMHLVPTLHAPGCIGKITALVVSRESRARGVGTALVRAAENWAKAQGAYRFEVVSGNHRPDAHRFYIRLGYRAPDQVRFTKDAGGSSD